MASYVWNGNEAGKEADARPWKVVQAKLGDLDTFL